MSALNGLCGVAPGADFATTLRDALRSDLKGRSPDALARVRILTNTRRAARRIEDVFADGPATLLPQIEVFTDLAHDPLLLDVPITADTALARRLQVMQLVRRLLTAQPEIANPAYAFDLAHALTALMDELRSDGVPLDHVMALQDDHLTDYWAVTLEFLKAIRDFWEADGGEAPASTEAATFAAIEAQSAIWQHNPPADPVIFAGSTGSRGISRALMKAVLALPTGAVVLPGFDFLLPSQTWAELGDPASTSTDHSQAVYARLMGALGAAHTDIKPLTSQEDVNAERQSLISLALHPAPVTNLWMGERDTVAAQAPAATQGLSLMLAQNQTEEALAIAIVLRQALHDARQAILITPDATLSRRVSAQLRRWNITPDDSAGRPLRVTPPAVFMDLVARFGGQSDLPGLVSILKHPLCAKGSDRLAHIRMVRSFDHKVLRVIGPNLNWAKADIWADRVPEQRDARHNWLNWLKEGIARIEALPGNATLDAHCARLNETLLYFSAGPDSDTAPDLWDKDAGQDCLATLAELTRVSDAGGTMSFRDFLAILQRQIADKKDREALKADPRIAIWGTLEARVQSGDLVILAGLNEDTWPKPISPDPWLNRSLRTQLGLSPPERTIGLAAHDFQQAICNTDVILTRSLRNQSAPSVASRWLTRLENLLIGSHDAGKMAWHQMIARGNVLLQQARCIDEVDPVDAEKRPCPVPPPHTHPKQLGVTEVEKLQRDPYAVYASKILRLKPISALGRGSDYAFRGIVFHDVMEAFLRRQIANPQDDPVQIYKTVVAEVTAEAVPWPTVAALWQARLLRDAAVFVDKEMMRQQHAVPVPDWLETAGEVLVPGPAHDVLLKARADRVDQTPGGQVALYDYKSAKPVTANKELYSKQLALEAKMITIGAFKDVGAQEVCATEIIVVGNPTMDRTEGWDRGYDTIWGEFLQLIEAYHDGAFGYAARLDPYREELLGDYDHLARRGEWKDGVKLDKEKVGWTN